jgi:predicted GNAT family acetyltransferase
MFKNERLVVWEYVSNGLDYVDIGTSPVVRVRLDARTKRITIEDNGRGMDWADLENFFVMHGENVDRKVGRPGRGRFGTGKSAAFGIGDTLRITSTRNDKRSRVELTRQDLLAADTGDPVPVKVLDREKKTEGPSGTLIEIEGIHLRSLDQAGVVAYIERHLAHWPKNVTVFVNNHECEFSEPPIERVVTFTPSAEEAKVLGDIELTVKVSKSPLGEDLRGIAIFSDGVWHETTLLSSRGKEMSEFIFGEVDVKELGTDTSTPAAFDASRSMRLNPDNALVTAIFTFVAPRIEEVRKALVESQREQRSTEQAKRLQQEASKIEEIINQDFEAFRKRLQKVKAVAAKAGFDASETEAAAEADDDGDDDFLFGGDVPATIVGEGEKGKVGEGDGGGGGEPRRLNPIVQPDPDGATTGHHEKSGGERPRNRGGFQIEFDHQGEASARAIYQREKRTIYVNLDHPQIAAALKGHGVEDPVFRRLAYEVAFSEYAIALAMELDHREEFLDPQDAIVEIRLTINRIALAAAPLYA